MIIDYGRYPKCFLHFFDIHFLDEYRGRENIKSELLLATKLAFLCSDSLIIPMASYFENDTCRSIVDAIKKDIPEYGIFFVGNSRSTLEFATSKLYQYGEASTQYKIYKKIIEEGIGHDALVIKKRTSTTGAIKRDWEDSVASGSFFSEFVSLEKALPKGFHDNCSNIHSLLGGLAYVPEHINKILFGNTENHSPLGGKISSFINRSYFSSYLDTLNACAVVTELRILHSDYVDIEKYHLHIPYKDIINHLSRKKIIHKISQNNFLYIYELKNNHEIIAEIAHATERYFSVLSSHELLANKTFINYGSVGAMGEGINNFGEIHGAHSE